MAGQRQPIALVQAKGKKHLTKAEIEERQRTEVKAAADKVTAPQYLSPTQKRTFKKIVKELRAIDLISNLDVDALARLVIAQEKYIAVKNVITVVIMAIAEFFSAAFQIITAPFRFIWENCKDTIITVWDLKCFAWVCLAT